MSIFAVDEIQPILQRKWNICILGALSSFGYTLHPCLAKNRKNRNFSIFAKSSKFSRKEHYCANINGFVATVSHFESILTKFGEMAFLAKCRH